MTIPFCDDWTTEDPEWAWWSAPDSTRVDPSQCSTFIQNGGDQCFRCRRPVGSHAHHLVEKWSPAGPFLTEMPALVRCGGTS